LNCGSSHSQTVSTSHPMRTERTFVSRIARAIALSFGSQKERRDLGILASAQRLCRCQKQHVHKNHLGPGCEYQSGLPGSLPTYRRLAIPQAGNELANGALWRRVLAPDKRHSFRPLLRRRVSMDLGTARQQGDWSARYFSIGSRTIHAVENFLPWRDVESLRIALRGR